MAKLMEFTIQGLIANQMWINRYNFFSAAASASDLHSLILLNEIGFDDFAPTAPSGATTMLGRYMSLLPSGSSIVQLYMRDVYNVADFWQAALSGSGWDGARAGEGAPTFNAAKIKSSRIRQDIKAGFKSLPGILEADSAGQNGSILSGYLTLMTNLCNTLGSGFTLSVSGTPFYANAIVKRESYETPKGKTAYQYFDDPGTQFANLAFPVTWTPIERVSSQVSRKIGRGR